MVCRRAFALAALTLSVAAPAVWAVPSFSFSVHQDHPTSNHASGSGSHSGGVHHSSNAGHSGSSSTHSSPKHESPTTHSGSKGAPETVVLGHSPCGVNITPRQAASAERRFKNQRVAAKSGRAGPVTFPVHFHIIAANETIRGGYLTEKMVQDQMDALNSGFDIAGFDFELVTTSWTVNQAWFEADWFTDKVTEKEAKAQTRQGDAGALNVWSAKSTVLGFAYFPSSFKAQPQLDGVMIDYRTVPGGSAAQYNLGATLVHEVGHWAGLYHTFQGDSCDGPGDYVDDTPHQSVASSSCKPSDTCSHLPGLDAYTNYMDYSPDACLSEFTTGQIRRMRDEVRTYRGITDA